MIQEAWDKIAEMMLRLPLEPSLGLLREMTLDEFGELLFTLPNTELQHLSGILPANTSNEVQERWTGASGLALLRQSISFLNFMSVNYQNHTGQLLSNSRILDFGCGWGRLMRLLPYFTDPSNLYGCDAWAASLRHISEAGVPGHIAQSIVQLDELPFPDVKFDLIYAFSIFTHLPESLLRMYLKAFHRSIARSGLVIITARPVESWQYLGTMRGLNFDKLRAHHMREGFAFLPADGRDQNYGDTSISRGYLESNFPEWNIVCMGTTLIDAQQTLICLAPR